MTVPAEVPVPSFATPWMNAMEAAAHLKRGRRFVIREIHAGRLRAATIGGRREVLTRGNGAMPGSNRRRTPCSSVRGLRRFSDSGDRIRAPCLARARPETLTSAAIADARGNRPACIPGSSRTRPKSHPLRPGQRFRTNLDALIEFHPSNLSEAKTEARRAIEAWLHGRDPAALQPADRAMLAQAFEAYQRRPEAPATEVGQARVIGRTVVNGRPFGEWCLMEITREAIEAFRRQRPRVAANRDLALLRAMFNWAVLSELVPATPFKVGTVAAVKLVREEARTRRLETGEDVQLLIHAGRLQDLITAALETGCRQGELLSLQWRQIMTRDVFLPAGKTKAKKTRRVPISSVLRDVLATPWGAGRRTSGRPGRRRCSRPTGSSR
jgi:integrase